MEGELASDYPDVARRARRRASSRRTAHAPSAMMPQRIKRRLMAAAFPLLRDGKRSLTARHGLGALAATSSSRVRITGCAACIHGQACPEMSSMRVACCPRCRPRRPVWETVACHLRSPVRRPAAAKLGDEPGDPVRLELPGRWLAARRRAERVPRSARAPAPRPEPLADVEAGELRSRARWLSVLTDMEARVRSADPGPPLGSTCALV